MDPSLWQVVLSGVIRQTHRAWIPARRTIPRVFGNDYQLV